MPERLVTRAEAIAALRVSRSTLDYLVRAGELRPTYVGRRVLFREADLADFITRRAANPRHARQPVARRPA